MFFWAWLLRLTWSSIRFPANDRLFFMNNPSVFIKQIPIIVSLLMDTSIASLIYLLQIVLQSTWVGHPDVESLGCRPRTHIPGLRWNLQGLWYVFFWRLVMWFFSCLLASFFWESPDHLIGSLTGLFMWFLF